MCVCACVRARARVCACVRAWRGWGSGDQAQRRAGGALAWRPMSAMWPSLQAKVSKGPPMCMLALRGACLPFLKELPMPFMARLM